MTHSLIKIPFVVVLALTSTVFSQSTTGLQGSVTDESDAALTGAVVRAVSISTNSAREVTTDREGNFQFVSMPTGRYRIEVRAPNFQTQVVEDLPFEVGRYINLEFRLKPGQINETVTVSPSTVLIERNSMSVGQLIDDHAIQNIPLNGRHFIDLGLLIPGTLTPPQGALLAAPTRGQGSFAMTTAGNREDTVNYLVNGINLNDLVNNILTLSPPIGSIQEFRIDNSTYNAEYGRNAGAIVNMATRSGSNGFHGELFEYVRNDVFDARNFFDFNSAQAQPFKRNQFGGSIGGPLFLPNFGEHDGPAFLSGRDRTFFFFTTEILRQRQTFSLNSVVLSDAQRASVADPIVRHLLDLIPRANFVDSAGTSRFVGGTSAYVDVDQYSLDLSHKLTENDLFHLFYAFQKDERNEPTLGGNTLPGFGDIRANRKHLFTLSESHVFDSSAVNEVRFGLNRFQLDASPVAPLNPTEFLIRNGITTSIGLPQINVAGGFNFGGPRIVPQGRDDLTVVFADTFSKVIGRHSLRIGGEYRIFDSDFFQTDPGIFNFPTIPSFLAGNANSFSITLGTTQSNVDQNSLEFFATDTFKLRSNLTFDVGLRYAWNITPTEEFDRFVVFDPLTASLLRVGTDIDEVYEENAANFQPRVGVAWSPGKDGRTVVRAAYAIATEQPMTNAVFQLPTNPPIATPLTFTGTVRFDNAILLAGPAGLAPITVVHDYQNSYIQSWNLNVQREVFGDVVVMAGYFGSKGTNLRLSRNINQSVSGVRPYPRLSFSSPVLPGAALGNITQVEGTGNSRYDALWVSAKRRLSSGLQFNASYTWSKSIDNNSNSSPPGAVPFQNSYDVRNDRGLSDFDARHRFVLSGTYELPFEGNLLVEGWQFGAILQLQSGNPVNLVTASATINGVANTVRPDVIGPVEIVGSVDQWFNTASFVAVPRFGNFGRNVIVGPGFNNLDLSVLKNTKLTETVTLQLRAEAFNAFNTPNFGQPGRVVGTVAFGRITNTRVPTGDTGSSRQLQFALRVIF